MKKRIIFEMEDLFEIYEEMMTDYMDGDFENE